MPTAEARHVQHRHGWSVEMYISPFLLKQLSSTSERAQKNARRSICARFARSCSDASGEFKLEKIQWEDLRFTPPLET